MKIPATLLLALAPIMLGGCAFLKMPVGSYEPAKITSFKDPDFSSASFRRIAVIVDTTELAWRRDLEDAMSRSLRSRHVDGIASYIVIPPTRHWDETQQRQALAGKGLDAYLRLIVDSVTVEEKVVPLTTSTTTTRERKKKPPLTGYDSSDYEVVSETVTTKSEGGETLRTVRMRYRAVLVEVASGRTAWIGLNGMSGDARARIGSFCDEIAAQLVRDSIVWRSVPTSG